MYISRLSIFETYLHELREFHSKLPGWPKTGRNTPSSVECPSVREKKIKEQKNRKLISRLKLEVLETNIVIYLKSWTRKVYRRESRHKTWNVWRNSSKRSSHSSQSMHNTSTCEGVECLDFYLCKLISWLKRFRQLEYTTQCCVLKAAPRQAFQRFFLFHMQQF